MFAAIKAGVIQSKFQQHLIRRESSGARTWYSISSSSDGTKLAANVYGGYIYTSSDSGATWTERTSSGARNWRHVIIGSLTQELLGQNVLHQAQGIG